MTDLPKAPFPAGGGAVVLPCTVDQFKDFISGLLGKPQSIERKIRGPFEIKREDIIDLHGLINQRVLSQNVGALMQFTATVFYDDDSSVRLDSFDDFQSYNEVKPLISRALNLNWVFLLRFPQKAAPERQIINVNFASASAAFSEGLSVMFHPLHTNEHIAYSIDHTDRTWGSDIDNLLEGALKKLVIDINPVRHFMNDHHERIGIASFILVMAGAAYTLIDTANRLAGHIYSRAQQVFDDYTVEAGTRLAAQLLTEGAWAKFGLYGSLFFVLSFAFAIFVGTIVSDLCRRPQSSFVLLTRQAKERREAFKAGVRSNWFKMIATGIITGAASVLAKYILGLLLGV